MKGRRRTSQNIQKMLVQVEEAGVHEYEVSTCFQGSYARATYQVMKEDLGE